MSHILVLDGHHRSSLTILRSLGRAADVETTIGAPARYLPGVMSKYADHSYIHPPLDDDPEVFVRELRSHLATVDYDAVVPVSDPTSLVCSKYREQLEATGTTVGVEDWETFEQTYDKVETAELAAELDVPAPTTRAPDSVSATEGLDDLEFPIVVKPRSKSRWTDGEGISLDKVTETNYVDSEAALQQTFQAMAADISNPDNLPLLQDYVEGEIRDTSVLAEDGEIVAYVQNRRIRTYPRSGGGYTVVESLHSDEMRTYAEQLVAALDWTGPVNFEFMYDGTSHELVEINGRYWGSLALAVNCGVDIPLQHYNQLVGDGAEGIELGDYEAGIQQRWLLPGDAMWLLETVEEGAWSDLPGFFESFLTARHDIPSLDDPLPTLGALTHMGKLGYDVVTGRRSKYGE